MSNKITTREVVEIELELYPDLLEAEITQEGCLGKMFYIETKSGYSGSWPKEMIDELIKIKNESRNSNTKMY